MVRQLKIVGPPAFAFRAAKRGVGCCSSDAACEAREPVPVAVGTGENWVMATNVPVVATAMIPAARASLVFIRANRFRVFVTAAREAAPWIAPADAAVVVKGIVDASM